MFNFYSNSQNNLDSSVEDTKLGMPLLCIPAFTATEIMSTMTLEHDGTESESTKDDAFAKLLYAEYKKIRDKDVPEILVQFHLYGNLPNEEREIGLVICVGLEKPFLEGKTRYREVLESWRISAFLEPSYIESFIPLKPKVLPVLG